MQNNLNKYAASNNVIAQSAEILSKVAPNLTNSALLILLSQVAGESDFGYAFKTKDGSPSHNWGAIMAPGDKGSVVVSDTHEGKPVKVQAGWNSSAEAGAKQFYRLISGRYSDALEKAQQGDLWGYAEGLFKKGYYGGFPPGHKWGAPKDVIPQSDLDKWYRITAYANMIQGNINKISSAANISGSITNSPPPKPENINQSKSSSNFSAKRFRGKKRKTQTTPDSDESSIINYIKDLFAFGTDMDKKKLYKKYLPINHATIKIYGDDFTNKIEFARLLSNVLDEELSSRSFIHGDNNLIEIQCNIPGPAKECFAAVNMIVNETNKAFKKKVINSNISSSLNINKKSSYESVSLDTIETEHRKFLLKFI